MLTGRLSGSSTKWSIIEGRIPTPWPTCCEHGWRYMWLGKYSETSSRTWWEKRPGRVNFQRPFDSLPELTIQSNFQSTTVHENESFYRNRPKLRGPIVSVTSRSPIDSAPRFRQEDPQEFAIFPGPNRCISTIARTPQAWISSSRHYSPRLIVIARDVKGVFRIGKEHGVDPRKIAISRG
jgi:hypothetical protein